MMRPRVLVGVGFAVVALGALAFAYTAFSIPPNTIVLKKDGFHPRVLTVEAGTIITFKNESKKYFWPASDFHPNHTLYPSFDAKEPLAPGREYTFTFSDAGTYPFHDHLAAYFSGIIRIKDADGTVPDDCKERGGSFQCWQNTIALALSTKGLDAAYDEVSLLYDSTPDFASSCHSITHNIGLASYQRYLQDKKSILSPKAVACGAGFYHGFMEGLLGASGNVNEAAKVCDRIGEALASSSPDARLQCFHGIGHGAMETAVATTGVFMDVDEMVGTARGLCEAASEGEEERYRCVSGLYNAIANFYLSKSYGLTLEKADPFLLCSRQPDVYKEACYGNMNTVAMWLGKNDFNNAVSYILSVPDSGERAKALEYLSGMNAIAHLHATSFSDVVSSCSRLSAAYQIPCVRGFAHGLLEHGSPGKEYEQALVFCGEPTLTPHTRDACYTEAIGGLSGWYSEEKSAAVCATVPSALQHYCNE